MQMGQLCTSFFSLPMVVLRRSGDNFTARRKPVIERLLPVDALMLQQFVNTMVAKATAKGLSLDGVLQCPTHLGRCPSLLTDSTFNPHTLSVSPLTAAVSGACLFNFGACLDDSPGSLTASIHAAWEHESLRQDANGDLSMTLLSLSSPTVRWAALGDFIVFCMTRLVDLDHGLFLGVALSLIRQFGEWLAHNLPDIVPFQEFWEVPQLKGLVRALRRDPRDNGSKRKDKDVAKQRSLSYFAKLHRLMALSPTRSLTLLWDGWRGSGEAMELVAVYISDLNLTGYLPYQVPL